MDKLVIRLRIFTQLRIFMNMIKEIDSKRIA